MDAELEVLNKLVGNAVRGETSMTKAECHAAMRAIARRLAKDGESVEKALVRVFVDGPGRAVFNAFQSSRASATIAKSAGDASAYPADKARRMAGNIEAPKAPVFPSGSGADSATNSTNSTNWFSFTELVDQRQRQHPGSRSAAIDAVMRTADGAAAYAKERNARLTKALGSY